MAERVDISIEQRDAPAAKNAEKHPNTCPKCDWLYRDDELEATLYVCGHCGHDFSVAARERIVQLTDPGSFAEEAAALRSDYPLAFFDLRPCTERLAEAELK